MHAPFSQPAAATASSSRGSSTGKVTLKNFGGKSLRSQNDEPPTVDLQCPAPRDAKDFLFCVISKGRSDNVPAIEILFEDSGTRPCCA